MEALIAMRTASMLSLIVPIWLICCWVLLLLVVVCGCGCGVLCVCVCVFGQGVGVVGGCFG